MHKHILKKYKKYWCHFEYFDETDVRCAARWCTPVDHRHPATAPCPLDPRKRKGHPPSLETLSSTSRPCGIMIHESSIAVSTYSHWVNSTLKASSAQTSNKMQLPKAENGSTFHYLVQSPNTIHYFYHLLSRRRCQTLQHSVGYSTCPEHAPPHVISKRKPNESREAKQRLIVTTAGHPTPSNKQQIRMTVTLTQPLIAILYPNLAMTPAIWNQTGASSFRE